MENPTMNIFRQIWGDIRRGQNVDLYVTVFLALGLAVLNVLGLASELWTISAILAALGILAVSALSSRHCLRAVSDSTDKALQAIQIRFGERPSAEQFFLDNMPSLEPHLLKAKDIRMSGVVLQRTVRDNLNTLVTCLKEGANIQIILLDPESAAARRTTDEHFPLERLKAHSEATWQNLMWLCRQPSCTGTLEIRLSEERLFGNIIAIDADKKYGVIFVEMRPQRWISGGSRPRFELRPTRDGYWFHFYKDQFDGLWKDCKIVDAKAA
jgi:hypothetical protein